MKTPATHRVGLQSPDDPRLGYLRTACSIHAQLGERQGAIVKPYNGPMWCTWCAIEGAS